MNIFNRSLIASLVLTSSSYAFAVDLPITVYGKVNISVQSNDDDVDDDTRIQSNVSRIGIKGEHELKPNITGFYVVEYQLVSDSGDEDDFRARNIYAGLKGDPWGRIMVGRNDTVLKLSQGGVDQFNDISGDLANLFKGDNRQDQTFTYVTPKWQQLQLGVTYIASDDDDQKGAFDGNGKDGVSTAVSFGDASLKQIPFFISVAYDTQIKGYDILRSSVQGKIGDLTLGAMYQGQENSDGPREHQDGYLLTSAYQIDVVTLKAQWQDMEDEGYSWSVGADYKLADPTKLFAFYTGRRLEDDLLLDNGRITDRDETFFGIGIEHKFSM